MRIEYSRRADADLEAITTALARRGSDELEKFEEELAERLRQLALFPESGALVPRREHLNVRQINVGRHLLIYVVRAETVTVTAVLHRSADR